MWRRNFSGPRWPANFPSRLPARKFCLPRSDRARHDLPDALRAAGAEVTEVVAYHTGGVGAIDPGVMRAMREAQVDVISFFSPSAIENLRGELGEEVLSRLGAKAAFAAVGPVTAAALRNAGLPVAIRSAAGDGGIHGGGDRKLFFNASRLKSEGRMSFPVTRPRRLRRNEAIRSLARETRLSTHGFIYPMFVCPGKNVRNPIALDARRRAAIGRQVSRGMPRSRAARDSGNHFVWHSGEKRRAAAREAYAADGVVQRAVEAVRRAKLNLLVMTDVCLCEYTDHGHCGIVENGEVKNDPTLELLAAESLSHARAGADIIAPSDMMDGRVGAIRKALDGAGFEDIAIMSYAAKYCSGFYGPFREAAESAPQFGDRRGYQMDPANAREALREVELDLAEGADMVMVKPALAYLDIIQRVRETFSVPVGAYNVSGEYAMVKAAAANGWIEEKRIALEILTGIHRAGASIMLTYHAKDAARWLKNC